MTVDWIGLYNDALDYIEQNLDNEISCEEAAKRAGCSAYHFQRMFPYVAGVPLSEYLRRRRLTRAALDLQNGDKVMDVAVRYGYDSPTAFNRAFRKLHGVSPSAAQRPDTSLKAYPRISFRLILKGEAEMEYRIVKKDAFRIVGVRDKIVMDAEVNFERVPIFWQETAEKGLIPAIASLVNGEPAGILGVSSCFPEDEDNWYYIAAVTDKPVPDGMREFTIPACTWAVFPGQGEMPGAIQELERRIVAEWLPTSGYEWAEAPDIEVYLEPTPDNAKYEVWLPIKKTAG